jgi:hypothetical protein
MKTAATNIPVEDAAKEAMATPAAQRPSENVRMGSQPHYLRYNVWDPEAEFKPTTAEWTLTAEPLPRPPQVELTNRIVANTIKKNPDLFKIVTPIKVDIFERLLTSHPNRAFVDSLCLGFREGFWPWANTLYHDYPSENDQSRPTPSDENKAAFLRSQLEIERAKGRFSPPFGQNLLPGMYSMPIFAVPKPNSTDFRLVTDQSHGTYSLNSMIEHDKITGYPLDNLSHLGQMLLDQEKREPNTKRIVWKSDIAEAYRLIPMHPCWQIKQVNTIDGLRYVDRCNAFGGCASGAIFIAFNSAVAWIAKYIRGVKYLGNYVDDSSGVGRADDLLYYQPYGRNFPADQVRLLTLWDDIGIPHKERKQVWGDSLTIIGIHVDANTLIFTLPDESKQRLVKELEDWSRKKKKERVRKWFALGGWINWGLNVFPLIRPALNNFYPKLKGRRDSNSQLWINNSIRLDFEWALFILEQLQGVNLLESFSWDVSDATQTVYCDACPEGMGFWYPASGIGFHSRTPICGDPSLIFYFEALCVFSALVDAHYAPRMDRRSRLVIYTDNLNTVSIFNTFRALPGYNHLLQAAVNILVEGNHSLRVLHVPGIDNDVADALSRGNFLRALSLVPSLKILEFHPWVWTHVGQGSYAFQPPRHTLGEAVL